MVMCMRTNIEIDDGLMKQVLRLTGLRTKREAVDFALREVVARHQQLGVLKLRGRLQWEGDLEASRQGRVAGERRSGGRGS
jgi:Arc/MetJ family transcription regulator